VKAWLTGVIALQVQLFATVSSGWPHNVLQSH